MLYLYGDSTEGNIHPFFAISVAVTYTIYSTLDNCDGKQARRTKSGSPMGMMFDHGLDAFTALQANIIMQRCG